MSRQTSLDFRTNAADAIADNDLRKAMRQATDTFGTRRSVAMESVEFDALREKASAVRMEVLDNLQTYLERFTTQATKAGATVHRAADAATANTIIADILKKSRAKMVAKGKSMVSEETQLNKHLENEGFEVVETDLGEYIIQLEGETPSHIIVPAIHKSRQQVGRLFADKLGLDYSEDPQVLTKIARRVLREKFLSADAGISGANFAIAESGSLVIFTNEGNGRMVTSVPPLHIAILTVEKILPSLADLPTFMRLLPRSATGQVLTSYVSVITGTRKANEATGAKELHIVLLDNGRSEILKGDCKEMLKCIRCGACINVCPVYRAVGGHAYGWTYPGPMGIVLTTLLTGMARSHPLVDASTLCGACNDACPVKVPLQELILKQRIRRVSEGFSPATVTMGMSLFGAAVKSSFIFSAGGKVASRFWSVMRKLGGENVVGRLPKPTGKPFSGRMP
jgi:L-lactate dehydrogenase complex protein LldF